MPSFDELVKFQNDNGTSIQKAISNYKKTPLDRRTIDFFSTKRDEITKLWTEFNERDNVIRRTYGDDNTHVYFTGDFYASISKLCNEVLDDITTKYAALQKELTKASQLQQQSSTTQSQGAVPKASTRQAHNKIVKQQTMITMVEDLLADLTSMVSTHPTSFCIRQLKTIEQHWQAVEVLHNEIWNSMETTDPNVYDIKAFLLLECTINTKLAQLQDALQDTTVPASSAIVPGSPKNQFKLPPIELPKFNGNYLLWRQYRDLFLELIDKQNLSESQKLWYLKSTLSGEAAGLVRHFATTSNNYKPAWSVLNDRYENTRLLANATLNRLMLTSKMNNEDANMMKEFHDTIQECLLSLNGLGIDTTSWDAVLLHNFIARLPEKTHALWEQSLEDPKILPTVDLFLKFITRRFQSLEAVKKQPTRSSLTETKGSIKALSVSMSPRSKCIICKDEHAIYRCAAFKNMTPKQRLSAVQKANYCVNCLRRDHKAKDCTAGTCHTCNQKHNTLLHLDTTAVTSASSIAAAPRRMNSTSTLLSTVQVLVQDNSGNKIPCRALLDNGSQINFVTTRLIQRLGLTGHPHSIQIEGIGQASERSSSRINLLITSRTNQYQTRIEAQILKTIVSNQPGCNVDISKWNIPENLKLADPTFNHSGSIELLLGAGIFYSLLSIGQISLGPGLPALQNTVFGWIIGGEYNSESSHAVTCGVGTEDTSLNQSLERFWSIEESKPSNTSFTSAENRVEEHFVNSTHRDSEGRFVVRLPFQQRTSCLGESKGIALQRFHAVERKLNKNPDLKNQYVAFMREYEKLGHMNLILPPDLPQSHYFLPHHAVLKPDSSTTKCRVVFDASAKTSTNVSLNDILSAGPSIQDDVFTIIMRFRRYKYVFTADIEKMYRQILINNEDKRYQLIWWRENPDEQLKSYQLNTVTYGTTCAPYLAIRTLRALAEQGQHQFPLAAEAIKSNFYVDDVLAGADHLPTAMATQDQVCQLLKSAGLKLRKWCTNHPQLLQVIPQEDQETLVTIYDQVNEAIKTMGLIWNPNTDNFGVKVDEMDQRRITKRSALSDISQLFDPLGFLAPVTITAKMFLQQLWKLELDWDAALPQELHTKWQAFKEELAQLRNIRVPRHLFGEGKPQQAEVHIFSDASERGYGAVAYMRTTGPHNVIIVRLICAKSKVAPLKQQTLPRLELCAAVLAAQLREKLQQAFANSITNWWMWTDSTIVLGWINSEASNYHTFVANRISTIHQHSTPREWRHVGSQDNPADLVSRGLRPSQLINNNFWFYGPKFLHGSVSTWPLQPPKDPNCMIERRGTTKTALPSQVSTKNNDNLWATINHRNSFYCLQRIIAYMMRFSKGRQGDNVRTTVPNAIELQRALEIIIKHMQASAFADNIKVVQQYKTLSNNSSLRSLSPFLDSQGILRVGGRLEQSQLSYDAKHPMILPGNHPFTKLLFADVHKANLHTGAQSLLAIIRQRYWPIRGKDLARATVNSCVRCARMKPKLLQQMMGNLPADRVQPSRPFIHAGVDFFGPIWIHYKIRGKRPTKAYVSVFCCFSTKAVHMEVVSDLTTEAFIGALKRFVARRGHCTKLYCDNATNFVGANNQLSELKESIFSDHATKTIISETGKRNMDFVFIPPAAPHFGGLWEAAVKSAKHLLQKTIQSANLTYEELETVVTEAEAILNSRPLTPLSNNASDLNALTPAHFLIGEPLTACVDPRTVPDKLSLLTRWKLVTHLKSEFWKRWVNEYLTTLQERVKWRTECNNVQPGLMVIIKDENHPPFKWPLGRIINVIKGNDGLVRVVDVRTSTNVLRRPIHKLAPLPVHTETVSVEEIGTASEKPREDVARAPDQPDQEVHTNPPARKRAKSSIGRTMLGVLLTVLFVPLVQCMSETPAITIEPFNTNPGIYYENLGPAGIINSHWDIITYIDLQPYWRSVKFIQSYPILLENLCNKSREESCYSTQNMIQRLTTEVVQNHQLIAYNNKQRIKRGAINIVGNVANALFGVLDNEYAETMATTIKKIQQNEEGIAHQLNRQTSFIDATVSIMKKNYGEIEEEFKNVQYALHKTNEQLSNMQQQLQANYVHQALTDVSLQASLTLSYLERIQDSLLDVLIDTHHGKINAELISPGQLHDEVLRIKSSIPASLKLPVDPDDILKFYHLMTIKGRIVDKLAIFKITLPLVLNEELELLGLHPIPWKNTQTKMFNILQITLPYIITNLHRDQFYPLSELELRSCQTITEEIHLCHSTHPKYMTGSTIAACEMTLLTQKTYHSQCKFSAYKSSSYWKQLHDPNKWIYAMDQEKTLNAVCNTKSVQFSCKGTGILSLHDNCIIKEPTITIQGRRTSQVSTHVGYIPEINISQIIFPLMENNTINYQNNYQAHHLELKNLKEELDTLKLETFPSFSNHDIHHYIMIWICLPLILITALMIVLKYRYHKVTITSQQTQVDDVELITVWNTTQHTTSN